VSSFIKSNLITCSAICPDYLCSCNKKSRKLQQRWSRHIRPCIPLRRWAFKKFYWQPYS